MLSIKNLTKNFGGLLALNNVSFDVNEGEIIGLIGPNGSGKTTLFNCVGGIFKVTSGSITFKGKPIQNLPPYRICHLGIGRTYQNVRPFYSLSVYENLLAGYLFSGKSKRSKKTERGRINEIMKYVGLEGKEDIKAGGLPLAMRKRLEIGRALIGEPHLLLLDEVAAGLNLAESQEVVSLVKDINERGITVLMVEHVMPIIMTVCSRIVVLAEGQKVAEGDSQHISTDKKVIESYLGAESVKEMMGLENP